MEPTGALVAAAAAVGAAGVLSSFASAASQGMNTKGALPTTPPQNTQESRDLWDKVQSAIQKRRTAMTEQQRVDAGNELDAASKAYDAYLKKTKTAAAPLTSASEAVLKAAESKGPTASQALAAVPLTPASEAVLKAAEERGPTAAASPTTFGEQVLETRRQEAADARGTGQQDTDPKNLVDLVDRAIAVAKEEAAKPPPETLLQKASKVRLFANTRDWYAKRLAAITARKQQSGGRKTLRRGGANSALAPFVAAIKKKLSAISSDADEKPQVAFSRLVSAGGALDDAAGDKVATLLLPLANTFTRWRFGVRNMALRYSPVAVADAETLYDDIQTPVQIQRIFAANDSNLYKIKFPPTGAAPSNEELAAAGAAAAVAVATDTTSLEVVKPAEPGQDDQEFLEQAEPDAVTAAPDAAPDAAAEEAALRARGDEVSKEKEAKAKLAIQSVETPLKNAAAAARARLAARAAPTPALDAAGVPLPAPAATDAEVADAARESCADIAKEKLGTNPTFVPIPGDGWCYYNAILTGAGIGDLGALAFIEQLKPLMPEGWTGAKPILNHETGSNDTLTYADYVAKLGETYNGTTNLKYWPEGEYVSQAVVKWFKNQSPPRNVTLAIYEQTPGTPIDILDSYILAGPNTFYVGDDCAGNELLSLAHNSTNHFDLFVNTEEARVKAALAEGAAAAAASSKATEGNRGKLGLEAEAALAAVAGPEAAAEAARRAAEAAAEAEAAAAEAARVKAEAEAAAAPRLDVGVREQDSDQLEYDRAIAELDQLPAPTEFDDMFGSVQDIADSIESRPLKSIANRIIAGAKKVLSSTPADLKPGVKGTMTKALNAAKGQLDAFKQSNQPLPTRLEIAAALRRSKETPVPPPESVPQSPLPGTADEDEAVSRRQSIASLSSVAVNLLRSTDFTYEEQREISDIPPANTDIGKLYEIYVTFEKLSDTIRADKEKIVGRALLLGGRRRRKTPRRRRKLRNSTFRRHRKH